VDTSRASLLAVLSAMGRGIEAQAGLRQAAG
jgi:hypothetical protein